MSVLRVYLKTCFVGPRASEKAGSKADEAGDPKGASAMQANAEPGFCSRPKPE